MFDPLIEPLCHDVFIGRIGAAFLSLDIRLNHAAHPRAGLVVQGKARRYWRNREPAEILPGLAAWLDQVSWPLVELVAPRGLYVDLGDLRMLIALDRNRTQAHLTRAEEGRYLTHSQTMAVRRAAYRLNNQHLAGGGKAAIGNGFPPPPYRKEP